MEKTIKKMAYAGVGLASVANKIIKEGFNECVKEGMLFDTDRKDIVNNTFKTFESIKEKTEEGITNLFNEATGSLENIIFYNKGEEIDNLRKRVINLENRLSKHKSDK